MAGLRERVEAELARREAVASAATPAPWLIHVEPANASIGETFWIYSASHGVTVTFEGAECSHIEIERDGQRGRSDAEHVVLHDPADALARYAAARQILALIDTLRRHEATRRQIARPSGFADDLSAYANALEVSVAASLGIE